MIEIEKAKNGQLTLKYDGRYMHSRYNPQREAEAFANGNEQRLNKRIIVLYGLGLGYHVRELSRKIKKDSILYVFEWNDEFKKICEKYNPDILNIDNVKIITGKSKDFYSLLSEKIGISKDILVYKSSLDSIKFTNESLYNSINDYNLIKQSVENDDVYEKLGEANKKENLKCDYPLINEFINKYRIKDNKDYIIASAGPSLDDDLKELKENRDKFIIISVGSALRALINNGITPDAVVITDAKEIVKKQLEGFSNIPLCFAASVSGNIVKNYIGDKYIFDTKKKEEIEIKLRTTVAISAIDLAVKCGAQTVALLGQDLAFRNGKSHTETFKTIYGFDDDVKKNNHVKYIKGINGQMLETTQGFITFRNQIESLILDYPEVKFTNCSKGAEIKGAQYADFEDYVKFIDDEKEKR